jgi:hypothetical protein
MPSTRTHRIYEGRIELQNIKARFPHPDFSAAYKYSGDWGYARAAGMLRRIKWDDLLDDQFDLSGDATGWGLNLSSINAGQHDVIRFQLVFGEGIENYMNDSPIDVGIVADPGNAVTPIRGEPLPIVGLVIFLDHKWNEKFSSHRLLESRHRQHRWAGAERIQDRTIRAGQSALSTRSQFHGRRRLQWGRRENFSDGFSSDGLKAQSSVRYNYSYKLGG